MRPPGVLTTRFGEPAAPGPRPHRVAPRPLPSIVDCRASRSTSTRLRTSRHGAELKLGYKASAEQFGPRELLDFSVLAEQTGLDIVAVSDHFQPWRHTADTARR